MFKALSLIIIIVMLSVCVFALFGDALTEPFVRSGADVTDYAFSVDQLGNVFFIRREGEDQRLVVLDSTGEELLRTDIAPHFGQHFFVDNIYVLQNKNIWITGYDFEPDTLMVAGVKIAAFREDGSYIEDIYRAERSVFKDNLYRMVSTPDEDDRQVYFAALNADAGTFDVYAFVKDGSEPLRKIEEYGSEPGAAYPAAFHALPGGGLVMSFPDGTLAMYSAMGRESMSVGGARFDRFWSGAGAFYMRDAVSGTIYSSPHSHLRPVPVIDGAFPVSDERGGLFRDMHELAVSGVGNVLVARHTETGSDLYLGGFTFLPSVTEISRIRRAGLADWLVVIAVSVGIIIASVLIWEFFVHFMRMRMSMIIRQTLLTALVIFIAFFVLSKYLLLPSVTDALNRSYRDSLASDADVLLSAVKTGVPQGASAAAYNSFMEGFGDDFNLHGRRSNPVFAYLLARGDDGFALAASSVKYPGGITLSSFLPYAGIADELYGGVPPEGRFVTLEAEVGRQLAVIKPAGMRIDGRETYLCVIENLSELESRIGAFRTLVNTFLLVTGFTLAALLIITIIFHVITLRRLSGILHALGLGKYAGETEKVRSGDETGEMHNHIVKLSDILRDKDNSLQTLSGSYHRFIPERFLKLLGETRVEKVSKDMQTRIEGACVVVIRFSVSGGSDRNIFANANLVLENIVPVVGQCGGTVYDFMNNGFNGVFERSASDALSAALSIRDVCRRLNKQFSEESGIQIDLRAVLMKGDLTLGFIGDQNRMEPTAISDAYSLSESLVRTCFGSNVYIAATGEFYADIKDKGYQVRWAGKTAAGRTPIDFYDIYDSDPPALHEVKRSFADKFELGVNLFAKGDYRNAGKMFIDIIKHSTEDGIARNYLYLSEYNLRNTDKQEYYTAFENESERRYFSTRSEDYYSNVELDG